MNHLSFGIRTLINSAFTILLALFSFNSLAQVQFKPEVKYAEVDDVKLAYYTRGRGEPLIMIMGFAGTMRMWNPDLHERTKSVASIFTVRSIEYV